MKYYAVGNTPIQTGISHAKIKFLNYPKHCSVFHRCPVVHGVNLTEKMIAANFHANEDFAVFATKEEADAFSRMKTIITKPEHMKPGMPLIWDNYPVFTVDCDDDHLEFKPVNYYAPLTKEVPAHYDIYTYCTIARSEIKPVSAEYYNNNLDEKLVMDFVSARNGMRA